MKISTYNPVDMVQISAGVSGVDLGNVLRGNHNETAVVVKPVADTGENLTLLAMFLEDNADLTHTQFGKFKSATPIQGITPGSNYLSDYFVETPGIQDVSGIYAFSDNGLLLNASAPEYVWLDAEAGSTETSGSTTVNYRFVFEYN